jgi:hypothetical protein
MTIPNIEKELRNSQTNILSFIQQKHPEVKEEWQLEPHLIYNKYINKYITLDIVSFLLKTIIDNYDVCGITHSIEALYLLCFLSKKDKEFFKYLEEVIITNTGDYDKQSLLISLCAFELSRLFPKKASTPLTYALANSWSLSFNIEYQFNDSDLQHMARFIDDPLKKLYYQFRNLFSKNKIKYEKKELFGYYKRLLIKVIPNSPPQHLLSFEYEQFNNDWEIESVKPSKFDGKTYFTLIMNKMIPILFENDKKDKLKILFDKPKRILIISINSLNIWMELKGIKINQRNKQL